MCPAHVENLVDTKLVGSTSLTERLRLWDKYARAPVNQEAVRLEFFRKVRTGRLYQVWSQTRFSYPFCVVLKMIACNDDITPHWRVNCSLSFLPATSSTLSQTLEGLF